MSTRDRIIEAAQGVKSLREILSYSALLLIVGLTAGAFLRERWREIRDTPTLAASTQVAVDSLVVWRVDHETTHAQIQRRLARMDSAFAQIRIQVEAQAEAQREQTTISLEIRCYVKALVEGRRPVCVGAGTGG